MISITENAIDLGKVLSAVQDSSAGGTVLFVGSVRDHNDRGPVFEIYYEAYRAMAEGKIAEIELEIRKRWKINKFAAVHRTGALGIGEVSVAVAVSAEHREEAFEGCHYAIDAIKKSVPIWKKEVTGSNALWAEGILPEGD